MKIRSHLGDIGVVLNRMLMYAEGIIYKHLVWIFVVQEKIQSMFLGKRQ